MRGWSQHSCSPELLLCRGLQGLTPNPVNSEGKCMLENVVRAMLVHRLMYTLHMDTRAGEPVPWHLIGAGWCKRMPVSWTLENLLPN